METFDDGWIADLEEEDEQGLLICGIYCNICALKNLCLPQEIFRKAAL